MGTTFNDWIAQLRSGKDWNSWWTMLITVPWLVGILIVISNAHHDKQIAQREQQTVAALISHEVSNHNQFRYTFTVAGQHFTGLSQSPNEQATVGDHQTVFFDPHDPGTNSLQDFGKGQNMFGFIALAGTGTIVIACLILFSKWKERKTTVTN